MAGDGQRARDDALMVRLGFGDRPADATCTDACREMRREVLRRTPDRWQIGLDQMLDRNYLRNKFMCEMRAGRPR